jgi:hypothetical protein
MAGFCSFKAVAKDSCNNAVRVTVIAHDDD